MANRGWNNSTNHYPHNNAQIACRLCGQVFANREGLIAHIDSHLVREEVNFGGLQNHIPKASSREAFLRSHHQLVPLPTNNNMQPVINRNVFETRPPLAVVPEVNRNGFDARSLMQKVTRNDFNNFPVMQEGNRITNVANNAQTFIWTNNIQPRSGAVPSVTLVPTPPPSRRNPSLLTYVPPCSLQPAQQPGFSSMTTTTRNNSSRGGGATHRRQQTQKRRLEEIHAATTEQTTRPFINMLETPIKTIDFIDLENMDEDESSAGSRKKKLDLALKL